MISTLLLTAVLAAWLPSANSAPAGSADAPKKLGDVFDVWSGKEADSCANYYDHAVEVGKGGGKALNDQWVSSSNETWLAVGLHLRRIRS